MIKRILQAFSLILASLFCALPAPAETASGDETSLLCLNIGKADCMLLTHQDHHFLIDAGYAHTWPALRTALSQAGITRLDGVFLTHCHEDHDGALLALAESGIAVDAWYASPFSIEVEDMSRHPAVLAAARRGQDVVWLSPGMTVSAGENAVFTVLGPLRLNTENENSNSLVMTFSCSRGSILLTGDMKEDEAADLMAAGLFSPCDLLKISHHGDNKTLSKAILAAIRPKAAVILTDTRQEPDTPAPSVLKMLTQAGCRTVVSQDVHDAVRFTLTDKTIDIEDVRWDGIPERTAALQMSVSTKDDTVTIRNTGSASVSLKDYVLFSTKGNETLTLSDAELPPGGLRVIGSLSTKGSADQTWPDKKIWNKKKRDVAILYDNWGRPVAFADNGITD